MKDIGMLLLAVYLIVVGLKAVIGFTFPYDHVVLGVVAVATGVLLLMKK